MLVNRLGVEEGDGIVDLAGRRSDAAIDPKSRETLTTLFGALLTSYVTAARGDSRVAAPVRDMTARRAKAERALDSDVA